MISEEREQKTPAPRSKVEEQIQTTLQRLEGLEASFQAQGEHPVGGIDGMLRESFLLGVDLGSRLEEKEHVLENETMRGDVALEESEERFRLLVESTRDYAIFILDPLGFITSWNKGAERIKGYTADEIIGQNYSRFYTPEAVRQGIPKKLLAQALADGRVEVEGWRVRKDGSQFWATVVITALWDLKGRLRGFSKVVRDITARKHAEEALRRQTEFVKLLQEVAVAANEARTIDDAVKYTLARVCLFTGWQIGHALFPARDSDQGFVSLKLWHMSEPAQFEEFRIISESVTFKPEQGLTGMVSEAGGPVWIADVTQHPGYLRKEAAAHCHLRTAAAFPVLVGKKVAGVLEFYTLDLLEPDGELMDVMAHLGTQLGRVVERAQSEAALRQSETRFRTIFEGAAVGIELADLEGRLLESNPALQRMFGYTQAEIKRLPQSISKNPADLVADFVKFVQLQTGERTIYRLERPYKRRDGGIFWGRVSMSIVRDLNSQPQYAIGMVEDITERKQIEAELAELQRRLMEGQELERLHLAQELHDGPMQDLYGLLYHLKAYSQEMPESADPQSLQDIQIALQKVVLTLRTICGDLRPPSLIPFGLEKAIGSHADIFKEEHPELMVQLDLASDGQLLSDQVRLGLFRIYQQSISNIVRHAHARQVWVRLGLEDGQVKLEVQDDGEGFILPPRWIEMARQGHLGLVGASERAQAIGGLLTVESVLGEGTTLRVVAPLQAHIAESFQLKQ